MCGPLEHCKDEGLEPSGARLGVACKEHVGGSWLEAGMDGRDAYLQYFYLWHPKAGIMAEPERWPPSLQGQQRDDPGHVDVMHRHRRCSFLCIVLRVPECHCHLHYASSCLLQPAYAEGGEQEGCYEKT